MLFTASSKAGPGVGQRGPGAYKQGPCFSTNGILQLAEKCPQARNEKSRSSWPFKSQETTSHEAVPDPQPGGAGNEELIAIQTVTAYLH